MKDYSLQKDKKDSKNPKEYLNRVKSVLIDSMAIELANKIEWWDLKGLAEKNNQPFPVAVIGEGPPLILIHGFDSCFLEYRRLYPYLTKYHKLIIPDLYGFGFCPRPDTSEYGMGEIIEHLNCILDKLPSNKSIGLIGASMGGTIAIELARVNPNRFKKLMLLSPAGLTEKPKPIPPILDKLGVWFLKQNFVRKSLCNQAFANPSQSVGIAEQQIASIHLKVPGWGKSLAAFARKGGISNSSKSLPQMPIKVIFGKKDRILNASLRKEYSLFLGDIVEELEECGHLPHLEKPDLIAKLWLE